MEEKGADFRNLGFSVKINVSVNRASKAGVVKLLVDT